MGSWENFHQMNYGHHSLFNLAQETTLYGATVKIHEPVGVIGIACPDAYPLLGFVSLFAPAVVRGNTMIIIPSQKYPLSALDLYQVLILFFFCKSKNGI